MKEESCVILLDAEIEAWARFCRDRGTALATTIHADTGMSRLGLTGHDVVLLAAEPGRAEGIAAAATRHVGLLFGDKAECADP